MKTTHLFSILLVLSIFSACDLTRVIPEKEDIAVTLNNAALYELDLRASGDEESADIEVQAEHFLQSEILFDESTQWETIYRYRPEVGYVGEDYVEIKTCTGGSGVGCNHHKLIRITFEVTP
jgi:hypothetical protein